tara:strand:+ start:138 stop:683 length:546 start_codon:yes stop_codon:yes gene_type:complete
MKIKMLLFLITSFVMCSPPSSSESLPFEYNNYEKIQPNNCVVKSAILDVEFEEDCSKFVNNNAYIIELSNGLACNEIVISYEFQNEYQLAYIGFKNVENSRDFTVNNKFKILETVYDDFEFQRDFLNLENTKDAQYFQVERTGKLLKAYIVQNYESERYFFNRATSNCAFQELAFYAEVNN